MEQITVVIGDRPVKRHRVAAGVKSGRSRAVVVPGVAADMKLACDESGKRHLLGISFCGAAAARAPLPRKQAWAAEKPNMECGQWMKASPLIMKAATCCLWLCG